MKKQCQICGNKAATEDMHAPKEFLRSPIDAHCPLNIHTGVDTVFAYEMCKTCFKALLHLGMIE